MCQCRSNQKNSIKKHVKHCVIFTYNLISDTIITLIDQKATVTQAEVYTSLSLGVFHIVPYCRLCRFQHIVACLTKMHSTARPC